MILGVEKQAIDNICYGVKMQLPSIFDPNIHTPGIHIRSCHRQGYYFLNAEMAFLWEDIFLFNQE
jgi:hypothetical protein